MFVYRIDTNLTKEEAEDIYKNLTIDELDDLESFNMKAYDIEINGSMSSFVITTRDVLVRIVLFLRNNEIDFEYEDISDEVLIGQMSFKDEDFQKDIDNFIKENITIDCILDKINQFGMDCLSEVDRKFLENNK
jgi:hypothetical protein